MAIGARTRLYGVIGHPLGHTLSPALHNAAFAACGLDAVYLALPVEPAQLRGAIAGFRAWRLGGLNVTVPHKVAVAELVDGLTGDAEAAGAVNTLFWDGDRVVGDNTDIAGYEAMLAASGLKVGYAGKQADAGTEAGDTRHAPTLGAAARVGRASVPAALILGAGGSARAVALALARAGFATTVAARRSEQAQELVRLGAAAHAVAWDELAGLLPNTRLLVNGTPIGMQPASDACPLTADAIAMLPSDAVVHDLVYRPPETRLLSMARGRGLRTVDGGVMLVAQASAAFSRWAAAEPPVALMREAFEQAVLAREVIM